METFCRYFTCTLLLITLLLSGQSNVMAAATENNDSAMDAATAALPKAAREYHLKAAFLRYVAKFVEWPSESLSEGIINICVIGQVPYYKGVDSINGKVIDDKKLNVLKIDKLTDVEKKCQILFVAKTETDNIDNIIQAIQDKPVLGFGDMDLFAEKGGDMNFYIMNNRLAIMINPPAVERSQLKISPRMLKLVTVVPPIN